MTLVINRIQPLTLVRSQAESYLRGMFASPGVSQMLASDRRSYLERV